jgi:amidase
MKDVGGEVAGVRHTEGSMLLRDYVSPEDGEMTKRLRAAGFIIIGKTNTNEFGVMPHAESRVHGAGRNPWDLSRTCGGSSGGAAAGLAMRYVSVAHGNDGGGSIRIPASCCGVFGLKPSRGRSAAASPASEGALLGADHVLTRSVADSAAVLDAVCGATPQCVRCGAARAAVRAGPDEPGRPHGFTAARRALHLTQGSGVTAACEQLATTRGVAGRRPRHAPHLRDDYGA